jgi:membrane fusion protein (multidrug efflux system)
MTDISPSPFRSVKRWGLLLLACFVLIAVLAGLKYQQIQKSIAFAASFPERSASVTAVIAKPTSWNQVYRTIGEVRATRYVELRNEVEGRITKIGFVGGDKVEPGQNLLSLDSREEIAQLDATRAQLKLADLRLQRISELRGGKMASPEDYDSAAADKAVLQANLAALAARIDKKQLNATFAATTNLHTLEVGQYIAANTLITGLTGNEAKLWLDFDLPQDKADIGIGTLVRISGTGMKTDLNAQIISAEPAINAASRTRGYRALLDNTADSLSPGAVVDVAVQTGIINGVFRLPATAVRRSSFGAFVYLLELDETDSDSAASYRAVRQPVTVTRAEGDQVIITQGLAQGDLVAALGAFKLQQGLLVHVVERITAAQARAAEKP